MNRKSGFGKRTTALLLAVLLLLGQMPMALALEPEDYPVSVSWSLTHLSGAGELPLTLGEGESLSVKLQAEEGYALPASISVTGGAYSYDAATGEFSMAAEQITGAVSVTAEAVKVYAVSWSLTHLSGAGELPLTLEEGESLSVTLQAEEGFDLPEKKNVKVTGASAFDFADGVLTVEAEQITGDLSITAGAALHYPVRITWTLENLKGKSELPEELAKGKNLSVKLQPENDTYRLPVKEAITVGGTNGSFSYNASTGELSISAGNVTGPLSIEAVAVPLYAVTLAEDSGDYFKLSVNKAAEGDTVTVTKTKKGFPDTYHTLTVTANGGDVSVSEEKGVYSFTMPAAPVEVSHSLALIEGSYYTAEGLTKIGEVNWTKEASVTVKPKDPARKLAVKTDDVPGEFAESLILPLREGGEGNSFALAAQDENGLTANGGSLSVYRDSTPPVAPPAGFDRGWVLQDPTKEWSFWTNWRIYTQYVWIGNTADGEGGAGLDSVQYVIFNFSNDEESKEFREILSQADNTRDENIEGYIRKYSKTWSWKKISAWNDENKYEIPLNKPFSNYYVVKAVDKLGNAVYVYSGGEYVDGTPPTVKLNLSNDAGVNTHVKATKKGYEAAGDVTFSVTYSDKAGGYGTGVGRPSSAKVEIVRIEEGGGRTKLEGEGVYTLSSIADWVEKEPNTVNAYSVGSLTVHVNNISFFPDGEYELGVLCTDPHSNEGGATVSFTVNHDSAPDMTLAYGGYTGYDYEEDGQKVYTTKANASDTLGRKKLSEVGERNVGESSKLFYLKKDSVFTVALSSTSTLSSPEGGPWSAVLTRDEDGQEVPFGGMESGAITLSGDTLSDGHYTLTVTVAGLNELESVYSMHFAADGNAPEIDRSELKIVTVTERVDNPGTEEETTVKVPAYTPFGEWLAYDEKAERYIFLPETAVTEAEALNLVKMGYGKDPTVADEEVGPEIEDRPEGWYMDISGEKSKRFYLELSDKAGNVFTLKTQTGEGQEAHEEPGAPTLLDDDAPVIGPIRLYDGNSSLMDAINMLSFGVIGGNYSMAAAELSDASAGLKKPKAGAEAEVECQKYTFIYEKDCSADGAENNLADRFFAAIKGDGAQQKLRELAAACDGEILWEALVSKEKELGAGYYSTAAQSAKGEMIAVFRAEDAVGHVSYNFQCLILDNDPPYVSSVSVEGSKEGDIYTSDVILHFTVEDFARDGITGGGLADVSYRVFAGSEPQTEEPVSVLHDENIPAEKTEFSFDVTVPAEINSTLVHVTVTVLDAAGNKTVFDTADCYGEAEKPFRYKSDKGAGSVGYLNIDGVAPVVKVIYNSYRGTDSRYYYEDPDKKTGEMIGTVYYNAVRAAVVSVCDNNFDEEGVEYVEGFTAEDEGFTVPAVNEAGRREESATRLFLFEEGEHRFGVNSVSDKAKKGAETIEYSAMDPKGGECPADKLEEWLENKKEEISIENFAHFIVDTSAPTVMMTVARVDNKPFDGEYANCPLILTAKCIDENGAGGTLKISGAESGERPVGAQSAFTFTADGRYEFELNGSDRAGNAAEKDETYFIIDTVEPEITVTGVEDQTANRQESITPVVTVTDNNYASYDVEVTLTGCVCGEVYCDSVGRLYNGEVYTFGNIEEDDLYTLRIVAKDMADNLSEETIRFSVNRNGSVFSLGEALQKAKDAGIEYFNAETLPPVEILETNVDIITKARIYLTYSNSTLNLQEGKDYQTIRADVNGGWNRYSYVLKPALFAEDGIYRISLMTEDRAGNKVNKESFCSFGVDNTAPVLMSINLEPGETYNEESRSVSFLPKDNIGLCAVRVLLNDQQVAYWEGEEVYERTENGEGFSFSIPESNSRQKVRIVCTDLAGNENEEQLIENFFVTTNIFVRFYNNKPLFFGSIGGLGLLSWLLFLLAKRKKDDKKKK